MYVFKKNLWSFYPCEQEVPYSIVCHDERLTNARCVLISSRTNPEGREVSP